MLGVGVYGLIGVAAGTMGNLIWAGFLISAVAALLTALTYASLGSRYPKAGGAAYVAGRAFGSPAVSYVLGLTVMASGLVSIATASKAFASYATPLALGISPLVIGILFVGLLGFICFLGMRESSGMNIVCTSIELGGLLLVIAVSVSYWGNLNLFEFPSPGIKDLSSASLLLLQGAVLTFYAFIGFEDLLNVSEEVKDPARHFAPGVGIAVLVTCLVYLAVSISAVSVVPHQELAGHAEGPLALVISKAAPWVPAGLFGLIALFAIANTALLNFVMASRLTFGMARQKLLPTSLSTLHHTRRTPHYAIVGIFVAVVLLGFLGDLSQLAAATSVLLLLVFIVMNAALLVLKARPGEAPGTFEIPALVPICAILINLGLIAARALSPDRTPVLIAGLALLVIGASYAFTQGALGGKLPANIE
jgi:amino acid transporter